LTRRIEVAERGTGLLETKLRILAAEEQRFMLMAERTERAWTQAVAEADTWMARARVLSGQRGIRLATTDDLADVQVRWGTAMGVQYPDGTVVTVPAPSPDDPTPDNSALALAADAYRQALTSGAEHAAATAALAAVRTELATTRRRLRALQKRWAPRLEAARLALAESLEEAEREEGVRLRWSAGRLGPGTRAGPDEGRPR
jgi:V/A-type H+-transporting ATPase subunit D